MGKIPLNSGAEAGFVRVKSLPPTVWDLCGYSQTTAPKHNSPACPLWFIFL